MTKCELEDLLDDMQKRLGKQFDEHPQWHDGRKFIAELDLRDLLKSIIVSDNDGED